MRGERRLLRAGEYLTGRAARLLPGEIREERSREWAGELPAILRDPGTRPAARRAARMLGYAAGTLWGTARAPSSARARLAAIATVVVSLLLIDFLLVPLNIWNAIRAPGDWVNYYLMVGGAGWMAGFGWMLAWKIRRAGRPVQGIREAVVAFGASAIPPWLLSRQLRAVAADLKGNGQSCPPAPPAPARPRPPAPGVEPNSPAGD